MLKRHNLVLLRLNADQIVQAKASNGGERKQITHALLCGPYGQIFGTEKQCRKYFTAWNPGRKIEVSPGKSETVFSDLFDKAIETDNHEISDYTTTLNLVNRLFEVQDRAAF